MAGDITPSRSRRYRLVAGREVARIRQQPKCGRGRTWGKPAPSPADGHESDVKVITRAAYRSNGSGYNDFTHPGHIWVVAAPHSAEEKVTPKQLTSGNFNEGGAVWATDSSRIYYTTNRNAEPYYELGSTEIWSVSPTARRTAAPHKDQHERRWSRDQSRRQTIRVHRIAE